MGNLLGRRAETTSGTTEDAPSHISRRSFLARAAIFVAGLAASLALPPTRRAFAAPQFARPVSDVETTGWTPTPDLWAKLDEVTPLDGAGEFVQTAINPVNQDFTVALGAVVDPVSSTGHILRTRVRKSTNSTRVCNFTVELLQGTTLIASFSHPAVTSSFTTFADTLSAPQADAITSYAALRCRVLANVTGTGSNTRANCSWIEFEVPEVVVSCTYKSIASGNWSASSTWEGGCVPGAANIAEVRHAVTLNVDATVKGLKITAAGNLIFDPAATRTLTVDVTTGGSTGIENYGVLTMHPASSTVVHKIKFAGVNESLFAGGGVPPFDSMHLPPTTDPGLYVLDAGKLDLVGTTRNRWNRTGTDATWQVGDMVRVTPSGPNDYTTDVTFTPGSPNPSVNPNVPAPEVYNMTSNVVIEGGSASSGRSHIYVRNTSPMIHTLSNVLVQFMGPRVGGARVTGRWPIHFHHSMGNNFGTVVQSCVVRDVGSHAFVAHASHGITFRDCVAYKVTESPYWWDPPVDGNDFSSESDDITYDHCLAAHVTPVDLPQVSVGSAFVLGLGNRCTVKDCAAAGVQGLPNSRVAGYHWPGNAPQGIYPWTFDDNVAHNNRSDGLYFWQNDQTAFHGINRFRSYRCGRAGSEIGAYVIRAFFTDVVDFESVTSFITHAGAGQPNELKYISFTAIGKTGAGATTGLEIADHVGANPNAAIYEDLHMETVGTAINWVNAGGAGYPNKDDFCRPTRDGLDIAAGDIVRGTPNAGSLLRFQRVAGTAWQMADDGTITDPISPFCS